jgi:hypothetical protein
MALIHDKKNCLSGTKPVRDRLSSAPAGTKLTLLATRLVAAAEQYDLSRLPRVAPDGHMKKAGLARDFNNPAFSNLAAGEYYADDPKKPLQPGEAWNAPGTRRATLCGVTFGFAPDGMPLNPYIRTGLRGPGVLGQFGPNQAVDNGVICLKPDAAGKPTAYAIGITRKWDGGQAAFAGGFVKQEKNAAGVYAVDRKALLKSRVEEFFEEMISGSIALRPEYAARLAPAAEASEKSDQKETALKMEQVRALDPGFFTRLEEVLGKGRVCYEGPVLNGTRNTDTSWIETSLSWIELDSKTWDYIKGADLQKMGYALAAGDDAGSVVYHRLDGRLIAQAYDSHGAFFAYMSASFLLDAQEKGRAPDPAIVAQFEDMADYLERETKNAAPPPKPGKSGGPGR